MILGLKFHPSTRWKRSTPSKRSSPVPPAPAQDSDEIFVANIAVVDANAGCVTFLVSAFLDSVFRDLGDLYWNVRVCIWRRFAGRKHFLLVLPWEFRLVPQPRNARSPSGGRMPPSLTRGIFTIPLDRWSKLCVDIDEWELAIESLRERMQLGCGSSSLVEGFLINRNFEGLVQER